jgi:DNA excision repair protein ERCC-1
MTTRVAFSVSSSDPSANAILVHPCQKGNPILAFIRNVPYVWMQGGGDTVGMASTQVPVDYLVGTTTGVLFLSLRYHRLHPTYIDERLRGLGRLYRLRVVLVHVDVADPVVALKELCSLCIVSHMTLILAWSPEEAARYLETLKAYEHKGPEGIRERVNVEDYMAKLTDSLTSVRSVNKTDVVTLVSQLGSVENIAKASVEDILQCPGLGEQKAKRLFNAFNEPFLIRRQEEASEKPTHLH